MPSLGSTHRDSILASYESAFRDNDTEESHRYHTKCVALADARSFLMGEMGDREGWAAFNEWRRESLELGDSVASKMLSVGMYLPEPEAGELCAAYQYQVARARRLGKEGDLLAQALSMPMLDFVELHGLVKPRAEKREAQGECPNCGHNGPLRLFKEE